MKNLYGADASPTGSTSPLKTPVDFRSDNCGRAAPEMIEALAAANSGTALGYGADALTARMQARFSELFETPVRVYAVATGTAANAVALAASATPFGAVYCSAQAHVNTSECNATSFFGGGTKLVAVAGAHGKVSPDALTAELAVAGKGLFHRSQPAAVNIVQATDLGAVYSVDEVTAIGAVAHAHGLKVHVDGARFANAVSTLGCTPAQATWKAGVDILSFGVTKNGGLLGDAIVVFTPDVARDIGLHLRRAGLVWSKMRFASAQILAYVENDLWLRLAGQANAAAAAIAAGIEGIDGVTLRAPVQANELFVEMAPAAVDGLEADGILFQRRSAGLARFVCRWDTDGDEVARLIAAVRRGAALCGGRDTRTEQTVDGSKEQGGEHP